ncbi:probable cytochrome P450 303a1 [Trichogramma pretiosum]|uniref:probable cytochrome P450 303a1 n=1 Tax=Trichogramma pretiosum TaxID=7493 RepID=UPI0006C94967|nr:probable cytochrome P450 303a1 [Trichogramma pretiosum]
MIISLVGFLPSIGLVFLALLLLYYLSTRKPSDFPPGPAWLPVLGAALEIDELRKKTGYFSEACNALGAKYGSVIGLKIGVDKVIILNDFKSMKAMAANDACDGRPVGPVYETRTFGKRRGLLVVDGNLWVQQRRFILRHLREFGWGRTDMAIQIEHEASQLVQYYGRLIDTKAQSFQIDDCNDDNNNDDDDAENRRTLEKTDEERRYESSLGKNEKPEKLGDVGREPAKRSLTAEDFYVKVKHRELLKEAGQGAKLSGIIVEMEDFFGVPVLNALWTMMAGKRYNVDDQELIYLQRIFTSLLRDVDMIGCLFQHFPVLKYLAPDKSGYNNFLKTHEKVWQFIKRELENHKKTYNRDCPRDLMDVYLKALESDENLDETFSEAQLLAICVDLFIAGSETSSKALGFGFLFLVLYPEVQRKAQEEIDAVIGRDRLPSLNDRPNMTYLNAVVMESLRMFMGRTMNVPHRATRDTQLMGYTIPKDSMIVVNFNRILMNDFWGDPEVFRPERFIDETGKIVTPEQFAPFGIGRHRCMGETLAKGNLFVITAALLQNFTFSPVPGETPPRNAYTDGVTACPVPYRVLMTKRAHTVN